MKSKLLKKNIVFIVLFFLIYTLLSSVFVPKWLYIPEIIGEDGETEKYKTFYEIPYNTLDYLVLGTSHSFFSVNTSLIVNGR